MVKLSKAYGAKGLAVVGFPSNQFMRQEPGTAAEIKAFAQSKGFVDDASVPGAFHLMHKTDVKGADVDPVFSFLKREAPCSISWNFGAYFLVSADGAVESHANVHPMALSARIGELLAVSSDDIDVSVEK